MGFGFGLGWGATYVCVIEIFNRLQQRVIRIICSRTKYAHTELLLKELKILDVTNIYNSFVGQFTYRHHNNSFADLFDSYVIRYSTTHYYKTRQLKHF